jgi:hypothetical protein
MEQVLNQMKPSSSNKPSTPSAGLNARSATRLRQAREEPHQAPVPLEEALPRPRPQENRMGYLAYRIWNDIHYRRKKPVTLDQFDKARL